MLTLSDEYNTLFEQVQPCFRAGSGAQRDQTFPRLGGHYTKRTTGC